MTAIFPNISEQVLLGSHACTLAFTIGIVTDRLFNSDCTGRFMTATFPNISKQVLLGLHVCTMHLQLVY